MAETLIVCAHCGREALKATGSVNRSLKIGAPIYCGKQCAGFGRRKWKTDSQKRAEKAEYDRQYRAKNIETIKAKKADYFRRTYDPVAAAEHRKTRMAAHVEYCRQPAYRLKKAGYDRQRRAQKGYGEFADAYLLCLDLRRLCTDLMPDQEIRQINGTNLKSTKRRKDHGRSDCNQS